MLSILQSGKEWRYAVKSICVHTWFSMQSVRAPDEVVVIAGGRRPCFIFSPPSSLLSISKDFCLTSLGLPMGSTLGLSWISVAVVIHVCPLTQLSSVCFLQKKYWFAWRANQWPLMGWNIVIFFPSRSFGPLKGFYELTLRPSMVRNVSPSYVASRTTEIQWHCQMWQASQWGPRTQSRMTDTNLHC